MKFSDIVLSGFFTLGFVCCCYGILERTGIVPWIMLDYPISMDYRDKTVFEIMIVFVTVIELFWIAGMCFYWKVIKKEKIEF